MPLEIAGVVLDKLVSIEAREGARLARHAVPGLDGEYVQDFGRPSVRIHVRGIFFGEDASERLVALRGHLLGRKPVDFLCEITGQGYFTQVMLDHLNVAQRAGRPNEFDFECLVTEYIPPPPPPVSSPLGALDTSIVDEAAGLMDDIQGRARAGRRPREPAFRRRRLRQSDHAPSVHAELVHRRRGWRARCGRRNREPAVSATASLPDLRGAIDASRNAQTQLSGFLGIAGSLADGSANSPLQGITQALGGLDQVLHIDLSGLSQRLPQAITTIENAMPADALRFVEELKGGYEQVSGFLQNSELVRQVQAGSTIEQTALALVDDVLALFQARLADLGTTIFDADTLESVKTALSAIESMAAKQTVPAEELLDFLSENLLGVAPDLLDDATEHVHTALAVLDPFSRASLETRIAAARDAAATAFKNVTDALAAFDPANLAAYAPLEKLLQTLGTALDAALAALEALYAALTTAVAAPAWDQLFAAYADVLRAIDLEDVPTVDDAVDAMAETVESMLSRLSTSLSPEDLARQVALTSASIHELFAQSALAQVRQILVAFIGKIQTAIEQVPTGEVDRAVKGMLERVHQEIEHLGIDQVRTTIQNGFQTAHDFVDHNIDDKLLKGVSDALAAALQQFQNIPIAELGQQLATAIQAVGDVIRNLEQSLASGLHDVETLLASLDSLNFRPVADEVVDEIHALKSKLAAIRPEALSDVEKVAIQGALSILRAIDLTGMIENELKKGFAALDTEVTRAVQAVLNAWLEFRRRIGGFDGASLAAPVTGLLDEVGKAVQGINGSKVLAPLDKLVDELTAKAKALSPGVILDPLQDPYRRMMQTIERANPDVWVTPLRALHKEIDRLIELVNITPLLTTLEQKEKQLFAQAQQAIASALDAVHLPAPLDAFYTEMKVIVLALTDAIFADPDGTLRKVNCR
jgi:hypothetical protein